MKYTALPIFVVITLIWTSCHPIICGWDRGYKQLDELPSKDSIVGLYELTSKSKEFLYAKGFNKNCQLIIQDSEKYVLKNLPDFVIDSYGETNGKSLNENGRWFVCCIDSEGCMIELEGIQVMPVARKEKGRISILMTIGDGDECNGIIFEKKQK